MRDSNEQAKESSSLVFARRLSEVNFRFIVHGIFLAAFSIAIFAYLLQLFTPNLHYSIVFSISFVIVYTVGYFFYSSRVFQLAPSVQGYIKYFSGTLVNFGLSLTLLLLVVEVSNLDPLVARIIIALILAPGALWFHQRFSFGQGRFRPKSSGSRQSRNMRRQKIL